MLRYPVAALLILATTSGAMSQTPTTEHPTGLWVFEGTTCADEKLTGLRIEDEQIVLYDPMRVSFTAVIGDVSDAEKAEAESSFVDNSVLPATINSVEAKDGGYFFNITDDLGETVEFLITINDDQRGRLDANMDFPMSIPLLPCADEATPTR